MIRRQGERLRVGIPGGVQLLAVLAWAVTGAQLGAQTYFYDDAKRLIRVAYPAGNGISYTYDDADNLTAVSPIMLPAAPRGFMAERNSANCVELSWEDTSNSETGFTVMRRRISNNEWEEIVSVGANVTTYSDCTFDPLTSYAYRVAAEGNEGLSAYTAELLTEDHSAVQLILDVGAAGTSATAGSEAAVRAGYAVATINYGTDPYGTAVFRVTQNGVVVSEAGVPASPPTTNAQLFIDFRSGVRGNHFQGTLEINTGIAVVNRGNGTANVTYTLRDLQGNILTVGEGPLGPGVHFGKFIDQIDDVAPNFNVPSDFPAATRFGSLEVRSDQPLSILALRLTLNQRGESLFTSTPVADLSQDAGKGALYFPQFIDGNGSISAILLLNTSNSTERGRLEFFGDNGAPLAIQQLDGPLATSFSYSIPPRGGFVFQTEGTSPTLSVGWVVVTPEPNTNTPVGAGVFQLAQNRIVVTESGVPSAAPTTHARIYVDTSGGYDTGLAIVNPGQNSTTVTLRSFELDGNTTAGAGPRNLSLNSKGHSARFVPELVSGLPENFTGVLEISSPSPFAALTLRSLTNARNEFLLTTFPVADVKADAPAPMVFPQIADGGGLATQFILIGGRGASGTTIRYFADDGSLLFLKNVP